MAMSCGKESIAAAESEIKTVTERTDEIEDCRCKIRVDGIFDPNGPSTWDLSSTTGGQMLPLFNGVGSGWDDGVSTTMPFPTPWANITPSGNVSQIHEFRIAGNVNLDVTIQCSEFDAVGKKMIHTTVQHTFDIRNATASGPLPQEYYFCLHISCLHIEVGGDECEITTTNFHF